MASLPPTASSDPGDRLASWRGTSSIIARDRSLANVGGACSILLGVSYVLLGIFHLLMPAEQQAQGSPAFFESFARNPTPSVLQWTTAAVGAALALGAVPAIAQAVRPLNEGLVRWMTSLAYLGFAAVAIDCIRFLVYQPGRAAAFVAGDATVKTTIQVSEPLLYLDAGGLLGFGGVGLWVLVVNLLALRGKLWPRPLAAVGVFSALCYWLVAAAFVGGNGMLFVIAAALGGMLAAPLWYVWLGLLLRAGRARPGRDPVP